MRARVPFPWEGKGDEVEFLPSEAKVRPSANDATFPVAVPAVAAGPGSFEHDRETVSLMTGQLMQMGCSDVDHARSIAEAAALRADRRRR